MSNFGNGGTGLVHDGVAFDSQDDDTVDGRAALRLGFAINLVAYAFGLIVLTVISLSDGDSHYEMLLPAMWWGVGVAGLGLALALVELVARFGQI